MDGRIIRPAGSLGTFALMAALEALFPRRVLGSPRAARWPGNLLLTALSAFCAQVLLPVSAVGASVWAASRGWGLFHAMDLPGGAEWLLSVALLDVAIYLQHVASHLVPVLWRLHKVHHADTDIDVTTGLRFHPVEIMLSMLYKAAVVVLLGAPASAVTAFEVLLNATALFNHANFRLPLEVDRVVRLVLVTPDLHRVHHSTVVAETNSNYGFSVPWWDLLFGTYTAQPAAGHDGMDIGLAEYRDARPGRLSWMLALPFMHNAREAPHDP